MAAAQEAHQEDHQSFIKTPSQLVWVMVLAFVVPVIALILLAHFVLGSAKSVTDTGMSDAEVRARITPVASVALELGGSGGAKVEKSGEDVYKQVCGACHATGAAGAPKFGDKAAWAPHIKEGLDAITKNAINGIRAMPARGGNPDFTDLEVTRAVVYMANAAGANFKEPTAPAAKPAAAAAAAPAKGGARTGEEIYKLACSTCHATGASGAPRIDDAAAWRKRFGDKTPEAVLQSAIKGHGGMPSRGGFADLTDPEMLSAVTYMFQTAQGKQSAAPAPAPAAAAPAAPSEAKGEATYKQACAACHAMGVAGAPKFGDKGLWAPRIKTGMDSLYASSIKGKGAMPPKGGNVALADADVKAAVDYMVSAAK